MKNRFIKSFIIILLFIMLFTGCNKGGKVITASGPQNPTSEIKGFYEQQQIVSGGMGGSSLNLSDIKITKDKNNETKMILSFAQGTQNADMSYTPSKTVPKYETSFAKGINRMIISMQGISYWSYKLYEDELKDSIINAIFVQRPVDREDSYLFINTKSDYAYKVEEQTNQIIITFNATESKLENMSYYASLNAYDEYERGLFADDFDMKPSACDDGENIILLSPPFESEEKARDFVTQNSHTINDVAPGKKFSIVQLDNTVLPIFSEEAGLIELAKTPIGYKDDIPLSFNPLIVNGRFLDFNGDKTEYVYAQPNTLFGAQEGDTFNFQYLCKSDVTGGLQQRLLDYQFESINSAKFSHDSKYVAYIEQHNDVLRMIQILSLEDGKLYIPADDGFDVDTAAFEWADDKNVLYAINGDNQSKQLLSYDLTNPNDVKVKGIFEQELSESILQIKNNKIYYAVRSNESLNSKINVYDINNGNIKELTEGCSLLVSPDGTKMLVMDIQMVDDKESYRLRYIDMDTGEEQIIHTGQRISDMTWSTFGSRVYYTVYRNAGWDAQYPDALYYFDAEGKNSIHMMDVVTSALYPSLVDEEVVVMCIFTYQNRPMPITYTVR